MARPLRIEYEGAWYHVMNRGLGRSVVFKSDDQRTYFLSLLEDTSERFNAEWHAYCLMGNHYHLLLRTPDGNLQRIMRHINGLYTQYFNRNQRRDGPLFKGRYRAVLVDEEAYWTQLSRYIHRNPLEAGMVKRLDQYRWSSYWAYIGKIDCPFWLERNYILKTLSRRDSFNRYKAYVADGNSEEIKTFFEGLYLLPVLGREAFKKSLKLGEENTDIPDLRQMRSYPELKTIVQVTCKRLNVGEAEIWTSVRGRAVTGSARGVAMYICQRLGGMTLTQIAQHFGLKSYASAGSAIRQFENRMKRDERLQRMINLIKLDLTP